MSRLSLRIRIMGAVALGLSAVLALLGLFALQMIEDSKARLLDERLITARAVADRLDDALSMTVQELNALVGATEANGRAAAGDAGRWRALAARVPLATYGLLLFDGRGVVIGGPPGDSRSTAFAAVEAVRQAAAGRGAAVSGLLQLPATRAPICLVCVPAPAGALCAAADLAKLPFDRYINGIQLGNTGHAVIVDAGGHVLASTDAGDRFAADEHPDFHARLIARREAAVGPAAYYHGNVNVATHIMAFAPLRVAPWGVSFGQTESETLAPIAHARSRLLAIGAAALLLALAFAWWDTSTIIRPLRLLAAQARRIAAGDLSGAVPVERGDEVGALAASFETMRGQIAEQKARLRELAAIEERERIGRDLHDSTMQSLYGISLALESARAALPGGDAARRIDQSLSAITSVSDEIRAFVRGLEGSAQLGGTLRDALDAIVAEVAASGTAARVVSAGETPDLPADARAQVIMIAHEAVGNAIRHGKARNVEIHVRGDDAATEVVITDDGRGFDSALAHGGSGLRNMRTRAASIGAAVDVESAPGKGTTVRVTVPRILAPSVIAPHGAGREAAS